MWVQTTIGLLKRVQFGPVANAYSKVLGLRLVCCCCWVVKIGLVKKHFGQSLVAPVATKINRLLAFEIHCVVFVSDVLFALLRFFIDSNQCRNRVAPPDAEARISRREEVAIPWSIDPIFSPVKKTTCQCRFNWREFSPPLSESYNLSQDFLWWRLFATDYCRYICMDEAQTNMLVHLLSFLKHI